MARQKNTPTQGADDPTNMEAVLASSRAASELVLYEEQAAAAARGLALRLGYEGSLAPDVLEQGLRSEQRRAVDACLNIGRMLLLLKEQCPHGEFIERLEAIGWEHSVSKRFMQAALKFSNGAASRHLIEAAGTQSKMFELLVLDDAEITELSDKGSVHGISIDDIDSMGVRELRASLREAKRAEAAKDRVIESKNKKLDKLAEAEEQRRSAPLPEQEAFQLDTLRDDTLAAESALQRLLASVDEVTGSPATQAAETAARHSLDYLVQRIVDGCLERGVTVDLADRVSPIWSQQIDAAAGAKRSGKKAR